MNSERTGVLRQSIEQERRKLVEGREALIVPPCADENEFASLYERASATLIFMQRAQQRLQYLEQSMATLENQSHSCCMDCGDEIPQRRLEAKPDAVRCIACQEELENEQKRLHSTAGSIWQWPSLNHIGE